MSAILAAMALSIILMIVEVLRRDDLSPRSKLVWTLSLAITSFFAATLYFAQGKPGRLARIASVLMVLGILGSLAVIVAALPW